MALKTIRPGFEAIPDNKEKLSALIIYLDGLTYEIENKLNYLGGIMEIIKNKIDLDAEV